MNADPVLIEDDDIDMVAITGQSRTQLYSNLHNLKEPVVVVDDDDDEDDESDDDDKIQSKKTNDISTVETIDLDDEPPIVNDPKSVHNDEKAVYNDENTIHNDAKTDHNDEKTVHNDAKTGENDAEVKMKGPFTKSEKNFIKNLKNNKLMDKIVTRCLTMENSIGMPRVIDKTLLPLYRDTNNRFKKSKSFTHLLKQTYKLLVRDPDHKFLHIKTLCEELKSGVLRRKVPFVTLSTELKNNGASWANAELESSSRPINENKQPELVKTATYIHKNKSCDKTTKVNNKRKNTGTRKERLQTCAYRTRSYTHTLKKKKTDIIDLDNSDSECIINLDNDDGRNDIIIIDETESSDNRSDHFNKASQETDPNIPFQENNPNIAFHENNPNIALQENPPNIGFQENNPNIAFQENDPNIAIQENDSNKALQEHYDSNIENDELENEKSKMSDDDDDGLDYELLIPQAHVEAIIENPAPIPNVIDHTQRVKSLETEIACYKRIIDQLEEKEVNFDSINSPYVESGNYKRKIVKCYKQISEICGNNDDIVKRCEIRLHVAEGHPPGPAKRLEQFLNNSIGSTGTVPFPDFSDVVSCVIQSSLNDCLHWDRQRVFQEAAALFRQCGQALRKRRQKREYRDLLSFVRGKDLTDDPAESDPLLLAKLEENKQIAKLKEDDILERYVSMENNITSQTMNHRVGTAVEFETDPYSEDSDSDEELNVRLNNNNQDTATNNLPYETGESSKSNIISNNIDVSLTNHITTNPTDNQIGESSKNNDVIRCNLDVTLKNNTIITTTTINNQCSIANSTISNEINNLQITTTNRVSVRTPAAINRQCEAELSNKNDVINNNLVVTPENTVDETITITDDVEMRSKKNDHTINENKSIEKVLVIDGLRDLKDIKSYVSCTSDQTVAQSDNAITSEDIKIEDKMKREPIDVQKMLDELGDNFVCTVFGIEDPFLVIEISSDGFSDDEL